MTNSENEKDSGGGLSKGSVAFLILTVLVLAGSLVWRFAVDHEQVSTSSGMAGFTRQDSQAGERGVAPATYVTAASRSGLLGFAAGFTIRKFLKTSLLLLGLAMIVVIALSWFKVITLDWQKASEWLNTANQDLTKKLDTMEALKLHLPSSATFATGVVMGVRLKGGVA